MNGGRKTNLKFVYEQKITRRRERRAAATKAHYAMLDRIRAEIAAIVKPFDDEISANDDALHQALRRLVMHQT